MKVTEIKLPRKPSDLIKLAIADMRKVLRRPKKDVFVDMLDWMEPQINPTTYKPNGMCSVCFAGAVMFGTLGKGKRPPAWNSCIPEDFSGYNQPRLYALNSFRTGRVREALQWMNLDRFWDSRRGLRLQRDLNEAEIVFHWGELNRDDPEPFFKAQNKLASILAKHNL